MKVLDSDSSRQRDRDEISVEQGPVGTIVVALDTCKSSLVPLVWAADLARTEHYSIALVRSWSFPFQAFQERMVPLSSDPKALQNAAQDDAERMALAASLGAAKTPYQIYTPEGPAGPELLRLARAAELLVLGSPSRINPLRFFFPSTTDYCVKRCPCPVVTVRR